MRALRTTKSGATRSAIVNPMSGTCGDPCHAEAQVPHGHREHGESAQSVDPRYPRVRLQLLGHFRGLAVSRQARTNRSHAGPIVMMNGRIVSLFECEWLSKMRKTTTLAATSIAADATIAILRPRMGP